MPSPGPAGDRVGRNRTESVSNSKLCMLELTKSQLRRIGKPYFPRDAGKRPLSASFHVRGLVVERSSCNRFPHVTTTQLFNYVRFQRVEVLGNGESLHHLTVYRKPQGSEHKPFTGISSGSARCECLDTTRTSKYHN